MNVQKLVIAVLGADMEAGEKIDLAHALLSRETVEECLPVLKAWDFELCGDELVDLA